MYTLATRPEKPPVLVQMFRKTQIYDEGETILRQEVRIGGMGQARRAANQSNQARRARRRTAACLQIWALSSSLDASPSVSKNWRLTEWEELDNIWMFGTILDQAVDSLFAARDSKVYVTLSQRYKTILSLTVAVE